MSLNARLFRATSPVSSLVLLGLCAQATSAEAQGLPSGWIPDGSGGIHIDAEISDWDWAAAEEALGEGFEGGFFSNKDLCDALLRGQISGFGEAAAAVLDFFAGLVGQCPSAAVIQPVIDEVLSDMKDYCEDMSGVYPTTLIAQGCEIEAFRVLDCSFTPPDIDPSCGGLRDFCADTGAFGEITPPTDTQPGRVKGYIQIPGCECDVFYVITGDPECRGRPGPELFTPRW